MDSINNTSKRTNAEQSTPEKEEGIVLAGQISILSRWAFLLFAFIFLIAFSVAWFVRYPEVIKIQASITRSSPSTDTFYATVHAATRVSDLRRGHAVQLRFADYPYPQYGFVAGTVLDCRATAPDVNTVYLELPASLNTSIQKTIPYQDHMLADLIVVVSNKRLFQKAFQNFPKK